MASSVIFGVIERDNSLLGATPYCKRGHAKICSSLSTEVYELLAPWASIRPAIASRTANFACSIAATA